MKRASFTAEAAFVIPICVFIIIVLVYTVFVMHDRACIYIEMGRFAEESIKKAQTGSKEDLRQLKEELEKRCAGHMFVCRLEGVDIECGGLNLVIKSKLTCGMKIFDGYNIKNKYYIADYSKMIRGIEIIK